MSCNPLDINIPFPSGPSGPAIIPYGTPFSLKLPEINGFLDGMPEDLLELLNKLQMLIPSGVLKPQMSHNSGKNIFDAILKVVDQFMPFLMMYKFFMPLLKLILCIMEVLCAIKNPFKLIKAMRKLFRNCLPDFLNLFPIFALIMMIISLLLLLLELIKYIIQQIIKLIKLILRNIIALGKAFRDDNEASILAIARKIGSLLCIFQNIFVLLSLFAIIIGVFKDMLATIYNIPPCDSGNSDGCCTPEVCPDIIKRDYTAVTGSFDYLPRVDALIPGTNSYTTVRGESWQLYDVDQTQAQRFRNIFDAWDVYLSPKPIFFATDTNYTATSLVSDASYTIDLMLDYDPVLWGRTDPSAGPARKIFIKECIMTKVPTEKLSTYDGNTVRISSGVAILAGGLVFETDKTTVVKGYDVDGTTPIDAQGTLENFIHKAIRVDGWRTPDGYSFANSEYTFHPKMETLLKKDIITIGCDPDLAQDRAFLTNFVVGGWQEKAAAAVALVNSPNFPDPNKTQECLTTAMINLQNNLTAEGLAEFQIATNLCLGKLQADTENAIGQLVGIGFDSSKSSFTIDPSIQFTSRPITVSVDLKERNGTSITKGLTPQIAQEIALKIKPQATFGDVDNFQYDGYQFFTANLSSKEAGKGELMMSFDNQMFDTIIISEDLATPSTAPYQKLSYEFIYAPVILGDLAAGNEEGLPRREDRDIGINNSGSGDS